MDIAKNSTTVVFNDLFSISSSSVSSGALKRVVKGAPDHESRKQNIKFHFSR